MAERKTEGGSKGVCFRSAQVAESSRSEVTPSGGPQTTGFWPPWLSTQTSANSQRPCDGLLKPNHDEFGFAMLCLEEQYAKISMLWSFPLPVRIAAKKFRWCWTYPFTSKLMWKIAKCAATPLRSVTPCRTKSWWNFRPGLWDDGQLECQNIFQESDQQLSMPSCGKVQTCIHVRMESGWSIGRHVDN